MKKLLIVVVVALLAAANFSAAQAGNVENGKKLFESPVLGGGTTGKSCMTCHTNGAKLGADLFERKEYSIMGMEMDSLADVVNICIKKALGGKIIDPKGEEMADIIAYMQSLLKPEKK